VLRKITTSHILDVKFLTTNNPIFFSQEMSNFMQEVTPLIGDFEMLPCEFDTGFLPITTSFGSFGEDSLQSCEFLFSMNVESGINNTLSSVVGEELFKTYINPNHFVGVGVFGFWNINLARKNSEPLSCLVLFYCQGFDFSFGNSVQDNWNTADSGNFQPSLVNEFEPCLRIGYASDSAFESGKALLPAFLFLASCEEVAESLTEPVTDILQDLGMNFLADFGIANFQIQNEAVEIILAGCPEFFVQSEKFIIDEFAVR
jgi:hypothetical protein